MNNKAFAILTAAHAFISEGKIIPRVNSTIWFANGNTTRWESKNDFIELFRNDVAGKFYGNITDILALILLVLSKETKQYYTLQDVEDYRHSLLTYFSVEELLIIKTEFYFPLNVRDTLKKRALSSLEHIFELKL